MKHFDRVRVLFALNILTMIGCPTLAVSGEDCEHGKREIAQQHAAAAKAFDEATGRDLRHFPPDPVVDFLHMKLQMRFDDLNDMRFSATETLTFTPIAKPTAALTLDAVNLKISSVKLGDRAVEFANDDQYLSMRFDPPLALGQTHELVIEYLCDHPIEGMYFTPSSANAPNYTAEVHTQGEAETNRHWFIAHDFPNERMRTELIVDVPAGFSASSNGKLVSNLTSGDRCVWHWLQDKPHVSYLVTLVIGKFDIVDLPPPAHARVPMKVWAQLGRGDDVLQTYGRTGEMIDLFDKCFGVPYPWARYDQILAKNFGGGMENTSATTMYSAAILDKTALLDGDLDGLIAHELCHMWTGDYITCKSWAHIWLNEGWASYGSDLWEEQRAGIDGYLDAIRGEFGVAQNDRTSTNDTPMVSLVYDGPDDVFGRVANPYPKGASVLHMLRMMLGDEIFWKGVRLYFEQHGLGLAETNDFRYAMEQASGLGLEWFFEQWCYRPGTPELHVTTQYDGATRELRVDVEQKQKIDEKTPAFRFTLPVVARTASGDETFEIDVREKTASFRTTLDGPPTLVAVDPHLHVLKTMTEDKPLTWWIEQASGGEAGGPTIAARHAAIEALADNDAPATIDLLATIIRNDKERHTLRNSAIEALSKYGSAEARQTLLDIAKAGVSEAKVRVTLVRKLRDLDKAQAIEALAGYAGNDESCAVRAAAIEGLAALKCSEQADLIVGLVDFDTCNGAVASAALGALAELDDARGLELAMARAAYGNSDRTRSAAISAVGRLAKHNQDQAVEFLLKLLDDPESRAANTAGAALAELGDARAEARIAAMAESARNPSQRESAKRWLETLRKKKG